jgi:isocitrate lyase
MTFLRAELRKSGNDIIHELGFQLTLRRQISGSYDLTTGQNVTLEETHTIWGTYSRFRDKEIDDKSILSTDRKLFVSADYEAPLVGDIVEGYGGDGRVVAVYKTLAGEIVTEDTVTEQYGDVMRMCVVR